MKRIVKLTLISISLIFSTFSWAGTSFGPVAKLHALYNGNKSIFIFSAGNNHGGKPVCSTVGYDFGTWAGDLSQPGGRAQYALLLAAQTQGKEVWVKGQDNCDAWSDRENPLYIQLLQN